MLTPRETEKIAAELYSLGRLAMDHVIGEFRLQMGRERLQMRREHLDFLRDVRDERRLAISILRNDLKG